MGFSVYLDLLELPCPVLSCELLTSSRFAVTENIGNAGRLLVIGSDVQGLLRVEGPLLDAGAMSALLFRLPEAASPIPTQ
jgi:hypothetical protein